jgi:hypothetical protein
VSKITLDALFDPYAQVTDGFAGRVAVDAPVLG